MWYHIVHCARHNNASICTVRRQSHHWWQLNQTVRAVSYTVPAARKATTTENKALLSPAFPLPPSRSLFVSFGSSFDYRVIESHIIPYTHTHVHITYCSMVCCVLIRNKIFYIYSLFFFSSPPFCSIALRFSCIPTAWWKTSVQFNLSGESKVEFVKLQVYVIESAFHFCTTQTYLINVLHRNFSNKKNNNTISLRFSFWFRSIQIESKQTKSYGTIIFVPMWIIYGEIKWLNWTDDSTNGPH